MKNIDIKDKKDNSLENYRDNTNTVANFFEDKVFTKVDSFINFCKQFNIDTTLRYKMTFDLKNLGVISDDILEYIWLDSLSLRNYIIGDNKINEKDMLSIKNDFINEIDRFMREEDSDLVKRIDEFRDNIQKTIKLKEDMIKDLNGKNAELFSKNMMFQSLSGFKQFMTSKNFVDIMKHEEYDKWIIDRNEIEYELKNMFEDYLEKFSEEDLKSHRELYKSYINNLSYLDEPWLPVNNGRFKYLDSLLRLICRFKKHNYKSADELDKKICDLLYNLLVDYFKKSKRQDYFQIIISENTKPFIVNKLLRRRVFTFLNHALEIEISKIYRGKVETDDRCVTELIAVSHEYSLKVNDKVLPRKIEKLIYLNERPFEIKKFDKCKIKGNIAKARMIKYPNKEFLIIKNVNM